MAKPFCLSSKIVVFTGGLCTQGRKLAEKEATELGCIVHNNITKNADYVIEGLAAANKLQKAKDLNLNILSEDEWFDLVKKVKKNNTMAGGKYKLPDVSDSDESDKDNKGPTKKRSKTDPLSDEVAAAASNVTNTKKKPKCKYWGKCYRTNASHFTQFAHPGDKDSGNDGPANADSLSPGQDNGDDKKILPQNEMSVGESVDIQGYRIKYTGTDYYCTCPGWKLQKGAVGNRRTCKHLKSYLGEQFEAVRVNGGSKTSSSSPKAVKNLNARSPRHKQIPQLLLAHKFAADSVDPTGWWISEKLNGVRAYWDGKSFYSRLGNEFVPPDWFIEGLPTDTELDGELFSGRKQFQSTVSIVKTPGSEDWKKLKYHVFDAPGKGKMAFEKRMEYLQNYFTKNQVDYAVVVDQTKCTGQQHVDQELDRVQQLGGEGLMLRESGSLYEHARSHTLLKVKTFYDAEAVVIAHEAGKGRNSHRMGALRCRMECGKLFSVGSGFTDAQRNKPPKVGSIIVYKFQELTNSGSPRFPTFVGEAADKTKPKDAVLPKVNVE